MTPKEESFFTYLVCLRNSHVEKLEEMFGKRDERFVLGSITRVLDGHNVPSTDFPNDYHMNGNCTVDIRISQHPFDNHCYDQGGWQIAHECVHLLDPVLRGGTNFLEEGLARWYQDEMHFHNEQVRKYIRRNTECSPNYLEAKGLVRECIPHGLIEAVKEIWSHGVRIGEINTDILRPFLPNVDRATVHRLCEKFPV